VTHGGGATRAISTGDQEAIKILLAPLTEQDEEFLESLYGRKVWTVRQQKRFESIRHRILGT
jgi:hypothetical protein